MAAHDAPALAGDAPRAALVQLAAATQAAGAPDHAPAGPQVRLGELVVVRNDPAPQVKVQVDPSVVPEVQDMVPPAGAVRAGQVTGGWAGAGGGVGVGWKYVRRAGHWCRGWGGAGRGRLVPGGKLVGGGGVAASGMVVGPQ
jgi:hypothetical protein